MKDAEIHYDQLQPGLSQAFRAEVIQTIEQKKIDPFSGGQLCACGANGPSSSDK